MAVDAALEAYKMLEKELEENAVPRQQIYAYQGFNADAIRNLMKTYEPTHKVRIADTIELITILLSRGTSVMMPGKQNMSQKSKFRLAALKAKYHIVPKLVLSTATDQTMTLFRIASSHPEIAYCVLARYHRLERPISIEFMVAKGYPDFPHTLQGRYVFAIFPPDIANNTKAQGMACGALAYMFYENQLLRKPTPGQEPPTSAEQMKMCIKYARIARKTGNISNSIKMSLMARTPLQDATAERYVVRFSEQFQGIDYAEALN